MTKKAEKGELRDIPTVANFATVQKNLFRKSLAEIC